MPDPFHPPHDSASHLRHPAVLAWLRMLHFVSRTENAATGRFRPWNLSLAQFDVIAQVGASGGMMQQELAERLLSTQGNVCQLVNGLEKRGLVERRPEGRTKRLFLTVEGNRLFREVVPDHERWLPQQFTALSDAEQRELLRLLRKLERSQRSGNVSMGAAPLSLNP